MTKLPAATALTYQNCSQGTLSHDEWWTACLVKRLQRCSKQLNRRPIIMTSHVEAWSNPFQKPSSGLYFLRGDFVGGAFAGALDEEDSEAAFAGAGALPLLLLLLLAVALG